MTYKIAIASGKGGTGKTTVSVNLHAFLREQLNQDTHLVDCDVEEPNDLLFFDTATLEQQQNAVQQIPEINKENCTYCGKCSDYCEFNAISIIPAAKYAKVDHNLCHSCGACLFACEDNAIIEKPVIIGEISHYKTQDGHSISEGRLNIGSPMQTLLIKELKKTIRPENGIIIYDAPPGTSCSVVETISDTNYVILVAEPTRFGLHDLKLMVELVENIGIPFGLVINKAGLGDDAIYDFIKQKDIQLLGEIPFSKAYASLYAKGTIAKNIPTTIVKEYEKLASLLSQQISDYLNINE